ncbi:hypothetical protein [Burkholderia sp. AU32262]|uniref:hypothetical protein n=1 Tax=Burkholderia sp. AU32262 TaxID=2879630 RepID=UPI001CF1FE0D|nr:hypothetical protein [Burkholderia sp. AU32262]MCA8239867.1 hypothetical protein [Burkholderia sp. AU32262]
MNLVQLAGMLPRDAQFREWVAQWMVPPREVDVDTAAAFIRTVCEITSRRELATDQHAADRFNHFLRRPFLDWRDNQQHQRRAA